jgi:hypothetical protein
MRRSREGHDVSEVRRAPYVHDQHHPDHGVRSASSWCVVTTADRVIRTTTVGGAGDGWARAVDARRPPMRSLSRDRSRLVLWPPAVKGRIIKSWFDHGRRMVSPGGRSGAEPRRGLVAALSSHECSGDAGSPDRAQRRGVEAFGGSFAVSRRGTSVGDMRADQCLPVGERHRLQSASPGRPWRAGPLVRSRKADHL